MKKILLLGTGGTIASVRSENGMTPGLGIDSVLSYIPAVRSLCDIDTLQVCSIDSTNMTPAHWRLMVEAIEERYGSYDGFVICHGTDTLAYTAAALSYMIQNSGKPVVITGSQKPINLEVTDARTNLADSFRYACDPGSHGVNIVFGGKVIVGTRARKERAKSYNAFSSINFPYPAVIQDDMVVRYFDDAACEGPVRFFHEMRDSVYVLKLIPGLDPGILPLLFERYDCLVIESFGVGGLPESLLDAFRREMERFRGRNKLVVMATQVPREGSNMMVYEVGRQVKRDCHLMEAYDMTLESVITKLMWIMGRPELDPAARRTEFYRTINHDVLFAKTMEPGLSPE
ncbi:MAG: asparaginase [Desulfovibrionaceae bacterium]|nr:asparaginase [Desulfovibrionaceae bacterium]